MQPLVRLSDAVSREVLCDALDERGIVYRVDNAGMHALLPLPDVMDMRVFVADDDLPAARRVLHDLGMGDDDV